MRRLRSWCAFEQQGTVIVLMAILLVIFISMAAMTVDGFQLFLTRNELRNAADAGALAGARFLYNDSGTSVNTGANAIAQAAATDNKSQLTAVEVNADLANNSGDVERGHWSFASQTFTPNSSPDPVALWGVTSAELDADPNFINAVRVRARRESTPAASFFARIFGYNSFALSDEAIAYIGFAGTLIPWEIDYPFAICEEALLKNGKYDCSVGRMFNSSGNVSTSQTAWWTDLNPCTNGGTNAGDVAEAICGPNAQGNTCPQCGYGNADGLLLGALINTTNGTVASDFAKFVKCWEAATNKQRPWELKLPVINCSDTGPTCKKLVGAVVVNVLWVTDNANTTNPKDEDVPKVMGRWSSSTTDPLTRWGEFVRYEEHNLQNADGTPALIQQKHVYFKPDCAPHIPSGITGGKNFGVLAQIPVLVK